ncbi:MAG: metallophosphoesterase family protein [Verrucomicrobiota bacterium]
MEVSPLQRILGLILAVSLILIDGARGQNEKRLTFKQWADGLNQMPQNRGKGLPDQKTLPLSSTEMERQMEGFFARQNAVCGQGPAWLEGKVPGELTVDGGPFFTFARRLVVPDKSEVFFHGDLHGDVHTLIAELQSLQGRYLDGFRILRPDVYFVFLGDYVDRGFYGVEVIYTLLRLHEANPDRVVLVRGNHENLDYNDSYQFYLEWYYKFGLLEGKKLYQRMQDLYARLPAVLYLGRGSDFLQCNHGGMEPGFRPGDLLEADPSVRYKGIRMLDRLAFFNQHPGLVREGFLREHDITEGEIPFWLKSEEVDAMGAVGFFWNDFTLIKGFRTRYHPGRSWVVGEEMTRALLQFDGRPKARVRGVFRAHQQTRDLSPIMRRLILSRGVYRHWQEADRDPKALVTSLSGVLERDQERSLVEGGVYTFNISPDSVYGTGCGFYFGTIGKLTLSGPFADWRLTIENTNMPLPAGIAPDTPYVNKSKLLDSRGRKIRPGKPVHKGSMGSEPDRWKTRIGVALILLLILAVAVAFELRPRRRG